MDDIAFFDNGTTLAKDKYEKKLESLRCSEDLLMKLAWDVLGYEQLLKQACGFEDELNMTVDDLKLGLHNTVLTLLCKSEKKILQYYKDLYTKKTMSSDSLLIFMISDELSNVKPYAVPVQFLSLSSMTDEHICTLELVMEKAMKACGMVPVGK